MRIIISSDYYDNRTYDMLLNNLNNDEKEHVQSISVTSGETKEDFLYKTWNMIINSLPTNYYEQYASYQTQQERNDWFQRYLDLPTKDMSLMPEIL
jgi:hypothetical protein